MHDTIPNTDLTPAKKKKHNLLMRIQGPPKAVVVVVVYCLTWGFWGHVANDPALQRAYHGGLPTRPKAFELPQTS